MVSRKVAIALVQGYLADINYPPLIFHRQDFKDTSYRAWAAKTILQALKEYPEDFPMEIVEYYMSRWTKFAYMNPKMTDMFLEAYQVAVDIQDIFYAAS